MTHSRSLPQDLYHLYCEYVEERTSLRDLVGIDGELCSKDYFCRIWKKEYPGLKLRATGDFMKCQMCTLLKDEIYGGGASGVRGAQDQAQMEAKRAEYEKHVKVGVSSAPTLTRIGRLIVVLWE